MTHYYIDEEAYAYLNEWSEAFRTQTKWCPYYDKHSQVTLITYPYNKSYTCHFEAKTYGYKFNLVCENDDGLFKKGQIAKGRITHPEDGKTDFELTFEIRDKDDQTLMNAEIHIMQVFCTAFVEANAFMWFGNLAESKTYMASGKNDGNIKIITFRKYKDSVYAISLGHHRSPEGVFKVRGHFRRLQSGKVIWIDEFLKGT